MTDVDLTQLGAFSTPAVIYCSHNLPFGLGATLNTERFAYLRMLIESFRLHNNARGLSSWENCQVHNRFLPFLVPVLNGSEEIVGCGSFQRFLGGIYSVRKEAKRNTVVSIIKISHILNLKKRKRLLWHSSENPCFAIHEQTPNQI